MRKLLAVFRVVATAFTVAAVVYAIRTKEPSGRFLGVPYEFRFPTLERVRERLWNPGDPRILTPHVFGVKGWSLNLYQVVRLLGVYSVTEGALESPEEPER